MMRVSPAPHTDASTQPRELYRLLLACPSEQARADEALAFLRASSGARSGFLFMLRDGQPALASSSTASAPDEGLIAEVARVCMRELDARPDSRETKTIDGRELAEQLSVPSPGWRSADGKQFVLRMLSTYRDGSWAPAGLVALEAGDDRSLDALRQSHIEALCNAFLDATR
jgi:hypothetical protein